MRLFEILRRTRTGSGGVVGSSPWLQTSSGPLYVKGVHPRTLVSTLGKNGIDTLRVKAGQFTEFRSKNLLITKGVSILNEFWFKAVRTPLLATGYIVIGEMSDP